MPQKRYRPEEIIAKLREAEVLSARAVREWLTVVLVTHDFVRATPTILVWK